MFFPSHLLPLRCAAVLVLGAGSSACTKKSGEAMVLGKEHIAAAEATFTVSPQQFARDTDRQPAPSPAIEEVAREMAPDEIAVDGVVMKKKLRGTNKDPRARSEEQWRLTIQMVRDGRQFTIQTDQAHYDKTKPGDRIKVTYREGKYTGSVWSAEIED